MIAFGFPGSWEWIVVLAVVLLFFGNRLPGVARSVGKGIVEFRKGLKGEPEEKPAEKKEPLPDNGKE